jgi:HAE1 family hydrophobic/amphiphilic exporter-1
MGMAVFSGMAMATVLGVLLVPMLFVLIEKVTNKKGHGRAPSESTTTNATGTHG